MKSLLETMRKGPIFTLRSSGFSIWASSLVDLRVQNAGKSRVALGCYSATSDCVLWLRAVPAKENKGIHMQMHIRQGEQSMTSGTVVQLGGFFLWR